MSGALKSIRKTFKKITKSAVGKFIVAAAVSYFTAGLGASVLGATGFGSTLSPMMTTVLSHAISGAATGGIMSAVSGGNIGKGLLLGAAGGAVMGGVQSALGNYTTLPGATPPGTAPAPSTSASGTGANAQGAVASSSGSATGMPAITGGQNVGLAPGVKFASSGVGGSSGGLIPGAQLVDTSTFNGTKTFFDPATGGNVQIVGTGRSGLMGWADRNPDAIGKMVSEGSVGALKVAVSGDGGGTGRGYAQAMESRIAADQANQQRIQASHSGTGGLLRPSDVQQPVGGVSPTQRWNTPDTAYGNGKWVFDQSKGRAVFVNNAAPA